MAEDSDLEVGHAADIEQRQDEQAEPRSRPTRRTIAAAERQIRRPGGRPSSPTRTVAPVVVTPDTAFEHGIGDRKLQRRGQKAGIAPMTLVTSQSRLTMKNAETRGDRRCAAPGWRA